MNHSDPTSSSSTQAETRDASSGRDRTHGSIGPYRLLQMIGEGGMGEVYEAEQTAPVHRRVAIKIIKRGMDTREVIARFESERQALALMNHRSIARVFDAGETEQGLPYFVMELVRGVPITEHCDRSRLTTPERLRLFQQVCDGVQHAHQKGVIHRDLKPSNVLVTTEEGKPVVKIIDFGVAKATAQRLTERTLFTELGQLIGTPEYMSPEQAEMTGSDIDTRTDVYALGVMLYELVCGALPFERLELRKAGFSEIGRVIREVDPPRPSTRLSSLGAASAEVAERRRTTVSNLARNLTGDLDWITMKALEKDRTRRYGSPAELAADLERHLTNEPVEAGPPSTGYRMRKFLRRHRAGVAAAGLVAAALVAGAGVSVWQAYVAHAAERRANREAETAKQVSQFLAGLFEQSTPGQVRDTTLTARAILDAGARRVRTELSDQPQVKAKLLRIIGDVYGRLGKYDPSTSLLEEAISINEKPGADPLELALSLNALAANHEEQGRIDAGLGISRRAVSLLERQGPAAEDHLGSALITLGNLRLDSGAYTAADSTYHRAITVIERAKGPNDGRIARCYNDIANVHWYLGDYAGAEANYRKGLTIQEKATGAAHYQVATMLHNISLICTLQGRYAEAVPLEQRALEIREKVLGAHHWHTALSLANMAELKLMTGHPAEAESLIRRALVIDREQFVPDKAETASDLDLLGRVCMEQGRLREAQSSFEETLAMRKRLKLGTDVPYSQANIASLHYRAGNSMAAGREFREALSQAGNDNSSAGLRFQCEAGLARIAADRGLVEDARQSIARALAAVDKVWVADHPDRVKLLSLEKQLDRKRVSPLSAR